SEGIPLVRVGRCQANNNPTRKKYFISSGFLYFGTFFLKQAVLLRLFQKVMGDGSQPHIRYSLWSAHAKSRNDRLALMNEVSKIE
ncbi:hypothetical protein ABE218_12955, partial [Bacillus smithii]|uniref:hypothetical protein n=1 Tax=Bacillus smithii TaxID=1479 RepID=UPI003D240971